VGYEYLKLPPPKPVEQVQDTANLQTPAIDLRAENQQQDSVVSQRQPNGNPDIYVVQKGDSLSSIAAKFGMTARKIGDYNNLQNINTLFVGQKLRIPPQ
jgi:LysM repeat protein